MSTSKPITKFNRPTHEKDDGHAHIDFSTSMDPRPNLQRYGYCVIRNVFTNKECDETINSMWKWLENLNTGIKRKDKKTWDNSKWPLTIRQGMIQHTLGQEEFMWKIREHPNVIHIFSQIYNTHNLLVSFDGAMIGRPSETGYVNVETDSWLHTDQNIIDYLPLDEVYNSKYYCIQGIANFEDCGDTDASLFVGETSHLYHSELFKHNGNKPVNNWYQINKDDLDFLTSKGVNFYKINAPKGSFILFDSRAIHSGFPHQKVRSIKDRFRYVIYVSLTPASRATKKDIENKIKAIKEGKTTSHWSSTNIKVFSYPYSSNNCPPYITRKENIPAYELWSDCRKKLAGLINY